MIDLDELQRAAMRRLRRALTRDVNRHSRAMVDVVESARARLMSSAFAMDEAIFVSTYAVAPGAFVACWPDGSVIG